MLAALLQSFIPLSFDRSSLAHTKHSPYRFDVFEQFICERYLFKTRDTMQAGYRTDIFAMHAKPPAASAVEHNVYKVFPNDLNSKYTVFGGLVMSLCDRTALIVAERHSGHACVTAAVDSMEFLAAARTGDTLIIKAAVNRAWRSSMEIGVRVTAENTKSQDLRHVLSAYLTFVALDEDGRPTAVPALQPDSDDERRRFDKAGKRRAQRLASRSDH